MKSLVRSVLGSSVLFLSVSCGPQNLNTLKQANVSQIGLVQTLFELDRISDKFDNDVQSLEEYDAQSMQFLMNLTPDSPEMKESGIPSYLKEIAINKDKNAFAHLVNMHRSNISELYHEVHGENNMKSREFYLVTNGNVYAGQANKEFYTSENAELIEDTVFISHPVSKENIRIDMTLEVESVGLDSMAYYYSSILTPNKTGEKKETTLSKLPVTEASKILIKMIDIRASMLYSAKVDFSKDGGLSQNQKSLIDIAVRLLKKIKDPKIEDSVKLLLTPAK